MDEVNEMQLQASFAECVLPPTIRDFLAAETGLTISPNSVKIWWPGSCFRDRAGSREVLQLLAEGKVMKEVGSILNISNRTVVYHKYRMMEKLGAKSTAELVKYAVRNHVIAA